MTQLSIGQQSRLVEQTLSHALEDLLCGIGQLTALREMLPIENPWRDELRGGLDALRPIYSRLDELHDEALRQLDALENAGL